MKSRFTVCNAFAVYEVFARFLLELAINSTPIWSISSYIEFDRGSRHPDALRLEVVGVSGVVGP